MIPATKRALTVSWNDNRRDCSFTGGLSILGTHFHSYSDSATSTGALPTSACTFRSIMRQVSRNDNLRWIISGCGYWSISDIIQEYLVITNYHIKDREKALSCKAPILLCAPSHTFCRSRYLVADRCTIPVVRSLNMLRPPAAQRKGSIVDATCGQQAPRRIFPSWQKRQLLCRVQLYHRQLYLGYHSQ